MKTYARPLTFLSQTLLLAAALIFHPPNAKAQPCVSAPTGLISWWRGQNNGLDTVGANHAILHGGVAFLPAKVGAGFSFDGIHDFATFPGAVFRDLPTFGFWIKTTQVGGTIIDGGAGTLSYQTWRVSLDGQGRLLYEHARNGVFGYVSVVGSSAVNDGAFHYIAVTTDQLNKTLKLYVDGAEQASYTEIDPQFTSWAYAEPGAQKMGVGDANLLPPGLLFAGILDEAELYDRPLIASEIASIYQAGAAGKCVPMCVPSPANLVAWWRGENNALDQQGNSHGTAQGNVSYVAGKVGSAFSFDGSSGVVALGNNSPFRQTSAISYSFWTRIPADGGGLAMGAGASGGAGYGGIYIEPTYWHFHWTPISPSIDVAIYSSGVTLPPNQWVHLAVSMDFINQTQALYVNGQPIATWMSSTPVNWIPNGGYNVGLPDFIGGRFVNSQFYFKGDLDEVDVYNRALSASEITAIYQAGSAGKCTQVCTDPPVITLLGSSSVSVECHGAYADAGAIALDDCSGENLTAQIVVTGTIDVSTPGAYTLTYNVSNGNGTPATPVVRMVTVVDTTAPVITLSGANPQFIECHSSFSELGATANDACAGGLPLTIGGTVNADAVGGYTLTYSATDPSGNSSSTTRTVNVVDTTAPVITCPPDLFLTTEPVPSAATTSVEFLAQGGTISENCDSTPTVTSSDSPKTGDPLTIIRTYTVTDASGNAAVCEQSISTGGLFATDAIRWGQPLARTGMTEDTDPSAGGTVKYRFKRGSTIPIQVRAVGRSGATVSGYANVIGRVTAFGNTDCDSVADGNALLIDNNGAGGPGGAMDQVDGFLRYNLDTKQLPPTSRCYILQITVIDTSTGEYHSETVSLQAK